MLYARRIHRLEKGARAASTGDYDTPINAGGGELGSIADSVNNISAGINTAVEERLKSERLKTELITNVSHDIRTPLTSIITYTDLLDHEGLNCDKAPEYLDVLKQKSQRLKTLTDELFEAAKAATGNIDVNLTELNIVSLINQVLGELDSAIKSSGLDLRTSLPGQLHARADGRLMQRILENLLSNVFKYSLPGSRVYLDASETADKATRIEIKNISSKELNFDPSELTERFKRGDDSRADGGSGLGLSIVQSFVSAQGGKFTVAIDGDLFKAIVILPSTPIDSPVNMHIPLPED
jgi:signal transduction histidine kinase